MLEHVARVAAAVGVPPSADLETGYDVDAATVRRAVDAGVAGGNLEDQVGGELFTVDEAAELLDPGTLGFLDGAIPYGDLQRRLGR
jgi:2-methylisocitrate lyase-like PEP mutase family enzyme